MWENGKPVSYLHHRGKGPNVKNSISSLAWASLAARLDRWKPDEVASFIAKGGNREACGVSGAGKLVVQFQMGSLFAWHHLQTLVLSPGQ